MRSPLPVPVAVATLALLASSACGGNYSNADLEFLNALPERASLRSKLPEAQTGVTTGPLTVAGIGRFTQGLVGQRSGVYQNTQSGSKQFNAILDALLKLVEDISNHPPTTRGVDRRVWGPVANVKGSGFDFRMVMERVEEGGFAYRLELRRRTEGEWFALVSGAFKGTGGIRKGMGHIKFDPRLGRLNGLVDPETTGIDSVEFDYLNDAPPLRVEMQLDLANGNPDRFSAIGYTYRELEDLSGMMKFRLELDPALPEAKDYGAVDVTSKWGPDGRGLGQMVAVSGNYAGFTKSECWDESFALVWTQESFPPWIPEKALPECPGVPSL